MTDVLSPPTDAPAPAGALELATGSAGHPPAGIDGLPAFPGYEEMRGMASMAVTLAAANAVPATMQNKPNDVFLVLLTGRELGIPPTTAIRECHVIDGKVTVSPKLRLALVRSSGIGRIWKDPASDAKSATWHAIRFDDPETTHSSTFTLEDARRVTDRNGKVLADKDNWKNYPQRMLSWRAAGYLLDDVFSEVGTGLYSPDEMGAMTDEDGQVIDVQSAEPLPGTKAPRGHRPPPSDPPAGEDDVAGIVQRIEAITARPSARAALLEMWHRAALPAPGELLARQLQVARAQLKHIEDRMEKGEWAAEDPSLAGEAGDEQPATGDPGSPSGTSDEAIKPEVLPPPPSQETDEQRERRRARAQQVAAEHRVGLPEPARDAEAPVPPPEASEGGSVEQAAAAEQSVDPALRALRSSFEDLPEAKRQTVGLQLRAERIKLADDGLTEAQINRAEDLIWEAMTS